MPYYGRDLFYLGDPIEREANSSTFAWGSQYLSSLAIDLGSLPPLLIIGEVNPGRWTGLSESPGSPGNDTSTGSSEFLRSFDSSPSRPTALN